MRFRFLLVLMLAVAPTACAQNVAEPVVTTTPVRTANTVLEARVDSLIGAAIEARVFPGAAVAVGQRDARLLTKGYGTFTYDDGAAAVTPVRLFDLASLTKVVATTTATMLLYERGRIDLDAPLARYLPAFGAAGKAAITVRDVLTHRAGLRPFVPFHTRGVLTREGVIDFILRDSLVYATGAETQYSDFGPISLALAIEQITGEPFDAFARREVFEPLGMTRTGYRPSGVGSDTSVVPTEVDRQFRKRLVQGEVHDEAAYILGGTAGHAGLFSTADDLARFATMLVNEGRVEGRVFLKPETIRLFTARVDAEGSTRALGWDTRSTTGYSSAGGRFGPRAFGHTGFTGTSMWIDPDAGVYAILLTNRVYPTRDNARIGPVRSAFADIVYTTVVDAGR